MTGYVDHVGDPLADAGAPPTAYRRDDGYTHRLFRLSNPGIQQAITLCGRRGLEVPGRGAVDCPECNGETEETTS